MLVNRIVCSCLDLYVLVLVLVLDFDKSETKTAGCSFCEVTLKIRSLKEKLILP